MYFRYDLWAFQGYICPAVLQDQKKYCEHFKCISIKQKHCDILDMLTQMGIESHCMKNMELHSCLQVKGHDDIASTGHM